MNGDLIMYTRANDPNRSNPATERLRIRHNGSVGIGTSYPSQKLHVVGNLYCTGSITGSSKSFLINHPSKDRWKLRHRCIEGPSADCIYRLTVTAPKGTSRHQLPEYFDALCEDAQVFCSSSGSFAQG